MPEASVARVSVVIATYEMAWCVARAVKSCQRQTYQPSEIIIVDDASHDNTECVVRKLMSSDERIVYTRQSKNSGHLQAILHGVALCSSKWIVLLDADDELTSDSIESRVEAAARYCVETGEEPGFVYGHVYIERETPDALWRLTETTGHIYPYILRELSLCPTISIMMQRDCFRLVTTSDRILFPDDYLVLTVARTFAVTFARKPVATLHEHVSPSRLSTNARHNADGIKQLVGAHRSEILRHHGVSRVGLWWLRIQRSELRAYIETGCAVQITAFAGRRGGPVRAVIGFLSRLYRVWLETAYRILDCYLRRHFDHLYF